MSKANRPTPWEVVQAMEEYDRSMQALDRIIQTPDLWIIPGPQTSDRKPRLEMTPRLAMLNRKIYGYAAEIIEDHEGKMLNTDTPYRAQVVVQIVYFKDEDQYQDSWMWARTNAFSSNFLTTENRPLMLGSIICGILTPTYGTHLTTQLESWTISDCDDWRLGGLGGVPKPIFFDLDPETLDNLPVLGGSGFDLQRLRYALAGVRLRPPTEDPHIFHRELAEKLKREKETGQTTPHVTKHGRAVSIDPRGVDDLGYRGTSKKIYGQVQNKTYRDESILAKARRTHSRKRSEEPTRGRSPPKGDRKPTYTEVGKKVLDPSYGSSNQGP